MRRARRPGGPRWDAHSQGGSGEVAGAVSAGRSARTISKPSTALQTRRLPLPRCGLVEQGLDTWCKWHYKE
jgi:hypothetical protein